MEGCIEKGSISCVPIRGIRFDSQSGSKSFGHRALSEVKEPHILIRSRHTRFNLEDP